jgi:hypothetical protein
MHIGEIIQSQSKSTCSLNIAPFLNDTRLVVIDDSTNKNSLQ